MGVDVINIARLNPGIFQRGAHGPESTIAILGR